ncbi:hypothetical protein [Novosphingobium capsulatum]|uniref:hypothetical protein n=1 Tax=Novosphingobium capsulatum TaxID=13688 RepID=UPI000AACDF8F|nr:hypothetical protein [Novosphingobium capsulatum]WQD92786.1 hypothetical protein U0041_17655 [Novosphingobium capsulatum]
MSSEECRAAWGADTSRDRAQNFDGRFPSCACEEHSLQINGFSVQNDELVAKIFTSPDTVDLETGEVVWNKLVRTYSDGLSMFRSGCTEQQVRQIIQRLTTGGAVQTALAGAAVMTARVLRSAGNPDRWFCLYDTESADFDVHSDLIGTWPDAPSKTQLAKAKESRLRVLRNLFTSAFVVGTTADQLIEELRARNFMIL